MYLDETYNLSYHIKEKISKEMKEIGIIKNSVKFFYGILLLQYTEH